MKKGTVILLVILGVIILGVIWIFVAAKNSYNSFVTYDQLTESSWAQVQNQYQRRMDLIPNLVATVRGYAEHESSTYQNVTEARAGLARAYDEAAADTTVSPSDANAFDRYNRAQDRLKSALGIYINAVHEAYPQLQASEQFMGLQAQLEGTENRIATARRDYIDNVQQYNTAIRKFPANIFAGFFGFSPKPQFTADAEAQRAPTVSF